MKRFIAVFILAIAMLICITACKHEHSFSAWNTVDEPNCLAAGIEERICECGYKEMRRVDALGHEYDDKFDETCNVCGYKRIAECAHTNTKITKGYAATCTATGLTDEIACVDCGELIQHQNILNALGHTLYTYTEIDNCKKMSITICTRSECQYSTINDTGVITHNINQWWPIKNQSQEPPCTIEKKYYGICEDCGATDILVEPAPGHNAWGDWYIEIPSESYDEIIISRMCNDCGIRQSLTKDSFDSDHYSFSLTEPTCQDAGCVNHVFITPDGVTLTYSTIIEALGHTYENDVCSTCGKIRLLSPGLYDNNNNLIASWDDLTNIYGMDVSQDYNSFNYATNINSPCYILNNIPSLSSGSNLVIDYGIKEIGIYAFYSCSNIVSVTFPQSITDIRMSAFGNCTALERVIFEEDTQINVLNGFDGCVSLTEIKMPSSVTYIDGFYDCISLKNIVIPNGVTTIGGSAFSGCASLESIFIPASVETIGELAFGGCTALANVTFAEDTKCDYIGHNAFRDCISLKNFHIPSLVTAISKGTFYNCTSLTRIEIPNRIIKIENFAFKNCTSLETVTFANNSQLIAIWAEAFQYCTSLTSIEIPDSLTHIDDYAFSNCTVLDSIIFKEGSQLTKIGMCAFNACYSLKSIVLSSSLESIGRAAFSGDYALNTFVFNGTVSQWNYIWKNVNWNYSVPATYVQCSDGTVPLK